MYKVSLLLLTLLLFHHLFSQVPTNGLDVQHYRFALQLSDSSNLIKGEAVITTKFTRALEKVAFDLVQKQSNGKGMTVIAVTENNKPVSFTQDTQHIVINETVSVTDETTYTINYEGIPADGLIIDKNKYGHRTFFSDNWPNRAHNWLPCNDHPSDKASVEFVVIAPDHFEVISNGLKTEESNLSNHLKLTHYREDVPLPVKVMVIGLADFAVDHVADVAGIPVESWVYPEDKKSGFKSYAIAKEILPWFNEHVGNYAYKKLANVQSKTIFGGMENAGAIFYAENSVMDTKIESLVVHEIAHQWFGNAASEKDWPHLWLSEGFATYMTHLYHEEKYGADSFSSRMKEDRDTVIAFSKKRNTPVVDTSASANPMQLLNANSYQKGGWVLHMLRRKLGDRLFWEGVRAYYAKYAGSNANSDDLRKVLEEVSGQNLKIFFSQWLYSAGQPKLDIEWKFDENSKELRFIISQQQPNLFSFPLDLMIDNSFPGTIEISDKLTMITMPRETKPSAITADPKVNLLASFYLHETK